MKIDRLYTRAGTPVADQLTWKTVDAKITDGKTGEVVFEMAGVEVPERWSQDATNILAQKYFRRRGVPHKTTRTSKHEVGDATQPPGWLLPSRAVDPERVDGSYRTGGETSARQVFHRIVGCWTYWGWRERLFTTEEDARAFYDETFAMLALQVGAPNSPQFFNTGLYWAYGIEGSDSGQWFVTEKFAPGVSVGPEDAERIPSSYVRPQPHACFIQTVEDDLVNPGGMMDLWTREARLFKHGSGSGSNFSKIRGIGEPLSGGGKSSGLMSFLRVGDRSAGSIKSGGTTRRAALMRCLDVDHPEIEEFVGWKSKEEGKAAAIGVGSKLIADHLNAIARVANDVDDGHRAWQLEELCKATRTAGVPESLIDRALAGEGNWPVYPVSSYEGEAIETVSGQNSNNSVRVPNDFLARVDRDAEWDLNRRTDSGVYKTLPARELWGKICHAAWASGDPGLQFDDLINDWNTCINDDRIYSSNPCGEFNFLDNNACNLASLNFVAFLNEDRSFDYDRYEHAVRLFTIALEISVFMASFPSAAIAAGSYNYRTLGLGFANLGGLLMRSAIPYDSDEGRAWAAGLTALMTGVAYRTSAEMADEVGPFPRWEANAEPMRRVLRNHARACMTPVGSVTESYYEGLSIEPPRYPIALVPDDLQARVNGAWVDVLSAEDFRNAQTTLVAPTGTISFVMDCDTTGIEPEFALIRYKSLAGGGTMKLVNPAVRAALAACEIDQRAAEVIAAYVEMTGTIDGCPTVYQDNGEPVSFEEGMNPTIREIFDCAVPADGYARCLDPMAHVKMVAAVQPFLSGAASKTINLPRTATVADVDRVYRECHRLGIKAVALFRDGCKLSQPLSTSAGKVSITSKDEPIATVATSILEMGALRSTGFARGTRERPEPEHAGRIVKTHVGDHSVHLTIGEYPDGRPCEIFLTIGRDGSDVRAWAGAFSKMASLALQYGMPLEEVVDACEFMQFEPNGIVEGHDRIKMCSSIVDLVVRILGVKYLGRDDLAQVAPPEILATVAAVPSSSSAEIILRPRPASRPTGNACPRCHNATLVRTGTCVTCRSCEYNEGCQ